jgi:hypothetical protein
MSVMDGPMTASIARALVLWCEKNGASLQSVGIALECVDASDTRSASARVDIEAPGALWRVTVWDHRGMADVEQLGSPSGEQLLYEHCEGLDGTQLEALMDDLAVRARSRSGC